MGSNALDVNEQGILHERFLFTLIFYCTLDDLDFYRDSNHPGEYYESPTKK